MHSLEKQATEHDSTVTEVHFKATLQKASLRRLKKKNKQTIIGSAYRHTDNAVSCHHVMEHNILLEKDTTQEVQLSFVCMN